MIETIKPNKQVDYEDEYNKNMLSQLQEFLQHSKPDLDMSSEERSLSKISKSTSQK